MNYCAFGLISYFFVNRPPGTRYAFLCCTIYRGIRQNSHSLVSFFHRHTCWPRPTSVASSNRAVCHRDRTSTKLSDFRPVSLNSVAGMYVSRWLTYLFRSRCVVVMQARHVDWIAFVCHVSHGRHAGQPNIMHSRTHSSFYLWASREVLRKFESLRYYEGLSQACL